MDALSYFALILTLGIVAQWFSWRFKLPSILLLLAFGFGLSVVTGVKIDDFIPENTLLAIVNIFVAIILFEGGMTLKFSDLKEAGRPVMKLCTITVFISAVLTFGVCHYLLGYDMRIAALIGAILVVTGPTVIAPLLRVIKPTKKLASIVKWEGIVVDPIGAILALLVYEFALAGSTAEVQEEFLHISLKLLGAGVVMPLILARLILEMLKRHLIPDFLESVFLLAVVAGASSLANILQKECGLLTVTIMGVALVNQKSVSVRRILEFKENLQVLIISLLFIMLSGRIPLESIQKVMVPGLILIGALLFVIRPLSIYLATLGSKKLDFKEQTFLAFLAPRGIVAAAVASVFALEFEHAAAEGKLPDIVAEQAHDLVPLVFLVIIGTVLFYGIFALPIAKRLGVSSDDASGILFAGADEWIVKIAKTLIEDGHSVMVLDTKYDKIADAKMEGVPAIRANILSEYAEHEIDLAGITHLIAATPNDEVNSLATQEYAHTFGSANVWQIAPADREQHHTKAVSSKKRARICFTGAPSYRELAAVAAKGFTVKKTQITDVFTLEDFFEEYGEDPLILFKDDEKAGLRPVEGKIEKASEGTTLYTLIPDEAELAMSNEAAMPMGL